MSDEQPAVRVAHPLSFARVMPDELRQYVSYAKQILRYGPSSDATNTLRLCAEIEACWATIAALRGGSRGTSTTADDPDRTRTPAGVAGGGLPRTRERD